MSRIRLILLSVLAVLAVSAVASASASAASEYFICKSKAGGKFENNKCNTEMTGVEEFEFQKIIAPAREAIEGTGGVAVLEGHVDGVRAAIECKKSGFKGEIVTAGTSEGTETFTLAECGTLLVIANHQAPEKSACVISPLEFRVKSQLVSRAGIGPEYEIKPDVGRVLVEAKLTGATCALSPKVFAVEVNEENKGIVCAVPEYAAGKVEHEVSCSSTGDESLAFGGKASFTNIEKVKLSSGAGWYVE